MQAAEDIPVVEDRSRVELVEDLAEHERVEEDAARWGEGTAKKEARTKGGRGGDQTLSLKALGWMAATRTANTQDTRDKQRTKRRRGLRLRMVHNNRLI